MIQFYPCGGRNTLLKVYDDKAELRRDYLFICDADLWVFSDIPNEYKGKNDLIVTDGYSLENELYKDGKIYFLSLLSSTEKAKKEALLKTIISWYAYQVQEYLKHKNYNCDFEKVKLLNEKCMKKMETEFTPEFLEQYNVLAEEEELFQNILENYASLLRGKYIFQVFEKIFLERTKEQAKYRKEHLLDMAYTYLLTLHNQDNIIDFITRQETIQDFFQS